ncbi:PPOX class F420-dependent oxidoreductase [soil metagenome]
MSGLGDSGRSVGPAVFTPSELAFLDATLLGRLATKRPDGTLQNSPVAFGVDHDSGVIDIRGRAMGDTRKFANVEHDGEVAFVVDELVTTSPWVVRGLEIRGRAEALRNVPASASYLSDEVIRLHPRRVISWGVNSNGEQMVGRDVST